MRGVIAELPSSSRNEVTILDMEASIEHLSRGTVRNVDTLLVVTEPYYRALETMGRTVPLARGLGLPRVHAVANKVRSPRDEAAIREYSQRLGVAVAGVVPFDESVQDADRENRSAIDYRPSAPAVRAIGALVETLTREVAR